MKKKLEELAFKASNHYDKKDYKKSIILLNKALKIENQDPDIFEKLGMCYFHLSDLNSCLNNLDKAQKTDPNNPFRYASRAFVKNGMGDLDGAIKDYEIAVHLDPKDAIAHNNLGLLQEKKGFDKQSKSSFKKADDLAPDFFKNHENLEQNKEEEKELTQSKITPVELVENEEETTLRTIKNVFNSKESFSEFLEFIKNGFKLK